MLTLRWFWFCFRFKKKTIVYFGRTEVSPPSGTEKMRKKNRERHTQEEGDREPAEKARKKHRERQRKPNKQPEIRSCKTGLSYKTKWCYKRMHSYKKRKVL